MVLIISNPCDYITVLMVVILFAEQKLCSKREVVSTKKTVLPHISRISEHRYLSLKIPAFLEVSPFIYFIRRMLSLNSQ